MYRIPSIAGGPFVPQIQVRIVPMETWERLRWLRERGGLADLKKAAAAYHIGYETVKKISSASGARKLTVEHAKTIAAFHHVSPGWLMFGEGTPEGRLRIPLGGFVVGGQAIELIESGHPTGETVDAVLAGPAAIAFEIRSDSMSPLAREGDIAFFGPPIRGSDIRRLVGQDCAVQLEDGRHLFKILERGDGDLYNLHSYNASVIRKEAVHEARKLLAVRRR